MVSTFRLQQSKAENGPPESTKAIFEGDSKSIENINERVCACVCVRVCVCECLMDHRFQGFGSSVL